MGSQPQVNPGFIDPWSTHGDYNTQVFTILQAIAKLQTATLVRVESCTNTGGVAVIGQVNVTPLVNQQDGNGLATPHVIVYNLPYLRIQGGSNAVIMDPQQGDIGVAVFASRDISKVLSTQAAALPGSRRKYDYADGIYLGTILSTAAPTQYVQLNSSGIAVLTPNALALQGNSVAIQGATVQLGASGGTLLHLANANLLTWITGTLIPALAAASIVVAPPPANSVTSATTAS